MQMQGAHGVCALRALVFRGANFREKPKVAVRINLCGFNFHDWMEAQQHCACMRTHSTEYAVWRAYGVHTPSSSAMYVLLMID